MGSNSQMGPESSAGSESEHDFDIASLNKQALNIIGEDLIPQNEAWIEKLAEFVKHVYDNHKHIKLIGCQFGSQLIAYALGGKIERMPSLPENL